eukprot:360762-Chlamydomonas_euryale.AAC.14
MCIHVHVPCPSPTSISQPGLSPGTPPRTARMAAPRGLGMLTAQPLQSMRPAHPGRRTSCLIACQTRRPAAHGSRACGDV